MIFEGDFVRLNGQSEWLEVVGIVDDMHIQLSNGAYVEASEKQIADYRSAGEVMVVTNPDLVLDPTKTAYFVKQTTVSH